MSRVALTWYVWETTQSPRALGLLTFVYMAPIILGGVTAGWLLDRFGRRRVMVVDNVVRGVVITAIPLLHIVGRLEIWHVYVVAAMYGSLMMISLAGGPSLIPSIVSRRHLSTANALETIGFTLSTAIGPPIAGILIATIGAPMVLMIDAASYLIFAVALSGIKIASFDDSNAPIVQATYRVRDAFALLFHNRILLATTLMYMAFNFGLGMMFVWMPIYATETLNGGPELYGNILGLMAIGSVASSILAGSLSFTLPLGTMICLTLICSGASLSLLAIVQNIWATAIGVTLFGVFNAPPDDLGPDVAHADHPRAATRPDLCDTPHADAKCESRRRDFRRRSCTHIVGLVAMAALSAVFVAMPGFLGLRVRELRRADG